MPSPTRSLGSQRTQAQSADTGPAEGFAVHAAMKLRRLLLRAADRVLPSELAVLEHSAGFSVSYLLAAIVDLGVPDELASGPKTAEELATRCTATPMPFTARSGWVPSTTWCGSTAGAAFTPPG